MKPEELLVRSKSNLARVVYVGLLAVRHLNMRVGESAVSLAEQVIISQGLMWDRTIYPCTEYG